MFNAETFPYISADFTLGEAGFRPYLPVTLEYQQNTKNVSALLDTGATVNVMPYSLGLELGYIWERQTASLSLTGNLANLGLIFPLDQLDQLVLILISR